MSDRRYEVVFFDFGGTLGEEIPRRDEWIWARLRDRGVERELAEVRSALEFARGLHEEHQPKYGAGLEDQHRYWVWWYQQLLARLNAPEDCERVAEWLWETQTVPHRTYPDTKPALESARRQGWRMGVISNWDNLELQQVLDGLGIGEFFDCVLPSAQAACAKPNPGIFTQALALMGVEAERAAHVGDSYHADVLGARGVGITGVLIARGPLRTQVDGLVVNSLLEVPTLLGASEE